MKNINTSIKTLILFILVFMNLKVSAAPSLTTKYDDKTTLEENILVYGLYMKYELYSNERYKAAVSCTLTDIPDGLTFDKETGILEGVPVLEDGKNYQSYDPSLIYYFEDGTTEYGFLGEYTIIRPNASSFKIIDTKSKKVVSSTGYLTNTLIVDITQNKNFAVVAKDYYLDYSRFSSGFEEFEHNGISVDFFVNGSFFKKESVAPYALNGDITGSFNNLSLNEGTYEISVRYYSTVFQKYLSEPESFVLEVVDNKDVIPVIKGIEGKLPNFYEEGFDMHVNASDPAGLELSYTADNLPKFLKLDEATGKISGLTSVSFINFPEYERPTSVRITVTNSVGNAVSYDWEYDLELEIPFISSFTFVDANTDLPIQGLEMVPISETGEAFVNISDYFDPDVVDFNIVANPNISVNRRVYTTDFEMNGAFLRKELVAPYAIGGDIRGDYNKWDIPSEASTVLTAQMVPDFGYPILPGKKVELVFMREVHKNKTLDTLVLYPNPAKDVINIGNLPESNDQIEIAVIDIMTNMIVQTDMISFTNNQLVIQGIDEGIYAVNFSYSNEFKTIRFVKE